MSRRFAARPVALAAALAILGGSFALAACSDDSGLGMTLSSSTLTVAPGGTGTTSATITREGGFSGAVGLSRSGGPTLIITTFSPAVIPNPATSSDITVSVGEAVPVGSYQLTIMASGENVDNVTRTLTVVVGAPE